MFIKKAKKLVSEARLIFQRTANPQKSSEAMIPEEEKEAWRDVDAMAKFLDNAEDTFIELAASAFPDDPEMQKKYAKQISDSLENNLRENQDLAGLWRYMQGQMCNYVAIREGFLNFYRSREDKIDINDFFDLGGISAETPESQEYDKNRTEVISKTSADLQSLLAEIQASNPDLPTLNS